MVYAVTKIIRFCYGHRLMNYAGKCRHLHGHNARVEVTLSSRKLNRQAMVRDFHQIHRVMKSWIEKTLDHLMILHEHDPLLPVLRKKKERFLALKENPTAEVLAKLIYDYAMSRDFSVTSVTLWETENSFATYRKNS